MTAVFCKLIIVFYNNDCYFRSWGHANNPSRSDRNHGIFRIDWIELFLVTGEVIKALMDGLRYELSRKIYRACNIAALYFWNADVNFWRWKSILLQMLNSWILWFFLAKYTRGLGSIPPALKSFISTLICGGTKRLHIWLGAKISSWNSSPSGATR